MHLLIKKASLLITIVCISTISYSQADFREGYIIPHDGDTLFGLVDYREGLKAYRSCDFRKSGEGSVTTYSPGEIKGYGFMHDKFFESREIKQADQPSQPFFLEAIVKGMASLYKLEGTFFVEKNGFTGKDGQRLLPLINVSKDTIMSERHVMKNSNQHISTLNMLLFDCVELRSAIPKTKLTEKPLTSLVERYNKCKGVPSIAYKAKKHWAKYTIGVFAGAAISQIDFETGNSNYRHLTGSFEAAVSPTLGISFTASSPRLSERLSFQVDVLYLSSKYTSDSQFDFVPPVSTNHVTIEIQQLKVPIGLRYTFPGRKINPYINVGLSSTLHLRSTSRWILEEEATNGAPEISENEALPVNKRQFGIWGGIGVSKAVSNKLNAFIELRYERTDGIAPETGGPASVESKVTNFQFSVGIRTR